MHRAHTVSTTHVGCANALKQVAVGILHRAERQEAHPSPDLHSSEKLLSPVAFEEGCLREMTIILASLKFPARQLN